MYPTGTVDVAGTSWVVYQGSDQNGAVEPVWITQADQPGGCRADRCHRCREHRSVPYAGVGDTIAAALTGNPIEGTSRERTRS